MNVPWWPILIMVVAVVPILHMTIRPWTTCRCCRGERTHRDPHTRRFVRHCRPCAGWGTVERPGRRTLRRLTGGRVFREPPARPIDGQTFVGNAPLDGGGRRRRRARTGHTERRAARRRSTGRR